MRADVALSPFTRAAAVRGGLVALAAGAAGFAVARAGGWGTGEAGTIAANAYGTKPAGGRRLAALDDIPSGGGVILADEGVVLVRGEDDDVHAFSATCTHRAARSRRSPTAGSSAPATTASSTPRRESRSRVPPPRHWRRSTSSWRAATS